MKLWLGNAVPDHTAGFVVLVIITNFMNNLNAPLSNVVYATGQMRNYELTFSTINLLIIPISFFVLKFGAPAEAAFVVYLTMTIFVQIGCLLVMRKLVSLSLAHYFYGLIVPIVIVSAVTLPLLYGIHRILPHNLIGIGIEYITIIILAGVLFYYVVLDAAEKSVVNRVVSRIFKR